MPAVLPFGLIRLWQRGPKKVLFRSVVLVLPARHYRGVMFSKLAPLQVEKPETVVNASQVVGRHGGATYNRYALTRASFLPLPIGLMYSGRRTFARVHRLMIFIALRDFSNIL